MKLYRIFLPKHYNDGGTIEMQKIGQATEEIREKFGSYSFNSSAILPIMGGVWTSPKQKVYREEMFLIELFIEDTFDNQKWMKSFKQKWQEWLKQEELFIISQNAEVM